MGLFGKSNKSRSQQPPDRLAAEAREEYQSQAFEKALELFGEAIDKLHTMYVFASSGQRHRQPSSDDILIIEGFLMSLGAVLENNRNADVDAIVQRTTGYLTQIAQTVQNEGGNAAPYMEGVQRIVDMRQ